jgi:hypothetical protein
MLGAAVQHLAHIQRVSGGIVNILGGGSMDNSE